MRRSLTLVPLLATVLVVAACGGSDTTQSQQSARDETRQGQAEPAPRSAPEETAPRERGSTQEDESSGLIATTIEGERVELGGRGDVTALYFMAGW